MKYRDNNEFLIKTQKHLEIFWPNTIWQIVFTRFYITIRTSVSSTPSGDPVAESLLT